MVAAQAIIGQNKLFIGRGEETEAHVQEALRLSPRDPWVYTWLMIAGTAMAVLGRSEEAVSWLRRSFSPTETIQLVISSWPRRWRISVGWRRRSRRSRRRSLSTPVFDLAFSRHSHGATILTYLAQREHITDGMRKAGVPEAMTAARRLAAILAADVVGYSRLMGEDEAGTAKACATPSVG